MKWDGGLIGLHAKVIKSKNNTLVGIEGKIIDETKNTIIIENDKKRRLIKSHTTLELK